MGSANIGVVVHAAGDLRVEELPEPEARPDEAVVEIAYGGICGSDLHYWRAGAAGESVLRETLLLGHEVVGTVAAPAGDGSGAAAGVPVAVHPATVLGDRPRYPADRPNLSPAGTYLGSAARLPHTQGAFARRVALPAPMLRPLPPGLSLREAAIVEPASVSWHAVARAGEVTGKRVLVVGCGPIGALAVAVLRRAGAAAIIGVDVEETPRRIARELGASETLAADDAEAIADTDADVVIEASGNHRGLESAVRGATRGGRIVMVGLPAPAPQPVLLATAITRELELVGSFRFVDEIDEVIQALADGSLAVAPVVTHEFAAENALAAFETAADASASGKVLLRF